MSLLCPRTSPPSEGKRAIFPGYNEGFVKYPGLFHDGIARRRVVVDARRTSAA